MKLRERTGENKRVLLKQRYQSGSIQQNKSGIYSLNSLEFLTNSIITNCHQHFVQASPTGLGLSPFLFHPQAFPEVNYWSCLDKHQFKQQTLYKQCIPKIALCVPIHTDAQIMCPFLKSPALTHSVHWHLCLTPYPFNQVKPSLWEKTCTLFKNHKMLVPAKKKKIENKDRDGCRSSAAGHNTCK